MEFYKKKLWSNKFAANENLADTLTEVERKYMDMQPVIQEQIPDKSKIQATLSEIRAHVEYLQNFGGTISEEQQQRIRQITRKYKDASAKYSDITEISVGDLKSPKLFRQRVTPEANKDPGPQNKVALVEVEEKLKSMRQRRLDRLSTFVAEQSKLSEERSHQNSDISEIEDAIRSIQKTDVEKKITFKSIVEEKVIKEEIEEYSVKISPKLSRNRSNESTEKFKNNAKSSSTRKFINKFNCTTPADGSSSEDLTTDSDNANVYSFRSFKPEEIKSERHSGGSSLQGNFIAQSLHKNEFNDHHKYIENVSQQDTEEKPDAQGNKTENESHRFSPLLSPRGKQRKAVYLYEHECTFLENEKRSSLPSLTTFGKELHQEAAAEKFDTAPKSKKHHFYENRDMVATSKFENPLAVQPSDPQFGKTFGKVKRQEETVMKEDTECHQQSKQFTAVEIVDPSAEKTSEKSESVEKRVSVDSNGTGSMYENVAIKAADIGNKQETGATDKGRNVNTVSEYKKSDPTESSERKLDKNSKVKQLVVKTETNLHRKPNSNLRETPRTPRSPLRNPLPLPRKSNYAERVLKKLQRNWESVNEILENDSDVDCDEIEDLKKTWDEANMLLSEYQMRIKKLEGKSKKEADDEKLRDIKKHLGEIEADIVKFRGLRRDSTYKQLSSRLSNYFLEITKMKCNVEEVADKKKVMLNEIERYVKMLEGRVNKNEAVLLEILDAQVRSIGTNCLCITKV